MDLVLISLIVAAIAVCVTIFILNRQSSKNKVEKTEEAPAHNNARAAARAAARNRLVNRIRARNQDAAEENIEEDEDVAELRNFAANLGNQPTNENRNEDDEEYDDEGEGAEWADREKLRKKLGTKKMAKLEAKAERKEAHQAMLREREERKDREKQLEEERKLRDEEERRLEKAKEDEEKRLREEQEKRDHEEYLKLKQEFTVDEEGQDNFDTELNEQNLLQKFVDHIKNAKVVILEDLAAEFKLRTQDVINRINQVQELGLLTGVLDDRGKFIYISEDELKQICVFIRQRGRVSITELAQSSNDLINLKANMPDIVEEIVAV